MIQQFKNRVVVVATMHQKEKVIAPILEQNLEVKVIIPKSLRRSFYNHFDFRAYLDNRGAANSSIFLASSTSKLLIT